MRDPRAAALAFEAVKVSMRQVRDGAYITLSIHPSELPVDLFMAAVGTRFQCALVILNDHDEPVAGKDTDEGDRAVKAAAVLAKNPNFQNWIQRQGHTFSSSEEDAAAGLRGICGIESRSELKTNREARKIFHDVQSEFLKGEFDE